jgi:bleomycin hydrolase
MKVQLFLLIFIQISVSSIYSQGKHDSKANILVAPQIVKLIESTPIKDQQNTGTCWSNATTSFIETEAIRLGKKPVVLSPMFYVIPTYIDKAEKYIRMHGNSYFTEGDLTFSVMKAYKNYGAIPEEIYSGKINNSYSHNHQKMNKTLFEKVRFYVDSGYGKMTRVVYRNDIENIITNTMGKIPEKFVYHGKEYSPKSFSEEMIGINPDNYIEITSFTHHPFYSKFILETEANWDNNYYLNLPINDFLKIIDNALQNNYSLCWDGDICDQGYNYGFAKLSGQYQNEKNITQQMRQDAFDNYTTKDDHNMHIIGLAKNKNGDSFYVIKNSSTNMNVFGYTYMSKEYLLLRTISVMVHKNAIPKEIKEKCNIID